MPLAAARSVSDEANVIVPTVLHTRRENVTVAVALESVHVESNPDAECSECAVQVPFGEAGRIEGNRLVPIARIEAAVRNGAGATCGASGGEAVSITETDNVPTQKNQVVVGSIGSRLRRISRPFTNSRILY